MTLFPLVIAMMEITFSSLQLAQGNTHDIRQEREYSDIKNRTTVRQIFWAIYSIDNKQFKEFSMTTTVSLNTPCSTMAGTRFSKRENSDFPCTRDSLPIHWSVMTVASESSADCIILLNKDMNCAIDALRPMSEAVARASLSLAIETMLAVTTLRVLTNVSRIPATDC
jgi:hypothetical protein